MQDENWKPTTPASPGFDSPDGPEPGLFSRLIAVFVAPGRAMEAVKVSPRWLVPGLVIMAVMALFAGLTATISGPEQVEMMKETKFGRMMSAEQLQAAEEQALNPGPAKRIASTVSAAAFGWIAVFVAGLVFLLFGRLAGGTGTFRQVMGVVFWAGLISYGLGTLVKLPLVLAKHSVMEVSTGLGAFAPGDPLSLGYQLLGIFDLFSIWAVAVMVIGFEKIHGFARGKAVVVTVLPWLLMSLVMIGVGRLFI
ncbi:MAG: Yip1 family protein [Candidatus Krumholzibacteriia bacterium]